MRKAVFISQWIFLIFLLGFLLFVAHDRQAMQYVILEDIIIKESDNSFITSKIVEDYLDRKLVSFDSVLITDFSKSRVEDILESHPSIKQAEVFSNQKGSIIISIEQKKPIIRIK